MIVRRDSRCRIGIVWYDNEAEADAHAARQAAELDCSAANVGVVRCGRDKGFDGPGEYAVVTP